MTTLLSELLVVLVVIGWTPERVSGQTVYLRLRGINYPNNSNILITDIGEGDNALLCVTDNTQCCRGSDNPNGGGLGEWYFPARFHGDRSRTGDFFYRNRGLSIVSLNRRGHPTYPTGLYYCEVPDSSGVTQTVYANIISEFYTSNPPFTISTTTEPSTTTTVPPTYIITVATTTEPLITIFEIQIASSGINTAGQQFNLTCIATVEGSTNTPIITWLDGNSITVPSGGDDTKMMSTVMSSGSTLTSILQFDPLQSSHAGTYTCQVSVLARTVVEMRSIDVTVVAPSIMVMVSGGTPTAGQNYSLTCTVSGADQLNPIITYQWFKTNPDTQVGINSSTLSFIPLRFSDTGQYWCDVTVSSTYLNQEISESSDVQNVTIQIPLPVSVLIPPPSETVYVGNTLTLNCSIELSEAVDIDVTVNTVWSGPSGTQLTTTTPAVLMSGTTYTSTATLNSAEISDSGVYTCRATVSPQTNSFVTASDEGSGMVNITIASVNVSITPSGYNTVGEQFNLTCTATVEGSSATPTSFQWRGPPNNMMIGQDDSRMIITGGSAHSSVLHFNPIRESHAGVYTCVVMVESGMGIDSLELTVNGIIVSVRILGGDQPLTVGGTNGISCISDAPANTIEWLDSQGRVVANVTSMNQLDLIFNPVNDSIHNTNYTCRVNRQDGMTATKTANIIVNVPPSSIMSNITKSSGSAVARGMYSLQCDISTTIPGLANTPTATWIGPNGSPVTFGGSITITSNTAASSILTFNSLTTSQAGNYTCEGSIESPALESPQTVRETEDVYVQIPPPTVIVDVPSGTLYAGTNITLTCTITVDDAVNTDIVVDVTWTPSSDRLNIQPTTGSRPSFTSTVTVSPLSSADTGFTCSAVIRPSSGSSFITVGGPGMDTRDVTVQVPSITVMVSSAGTPTAGQSYSLTCTVSEADQLNHVICFQWFKTNPETQVGTNSSTLSFTPLRLSDVGQYRCNVTVSSTYLSQDIYAMSDTEDLRMIIPTPVVTISSPDKIFVGSSPTLTCNVELSEAVNIEVTVNTVWSGPSGIQLTTTTPALLMSGTTYTSTATLSSVETNDSGVYTCRATVSPQISSFVSSSDESLGMVTVSIVPAPSYPTIVITTSQSNSITIIWIQPQDDVVDRYEIIYSYQGPCSGVTQSESGTLDDGSRREFTAEGLHEFSDYNITITAENGAGASQPVSRTVTTLPATPSGRPQSLTVTSTTPTTITIQWGGVECIEQNSEITGYIVRYGGVTSNVNETTTRTFTATGLTPRTNYTFEVAATSVSGSGPLAIDIMETAVSESVGFLLNGQLYGNNSIVTLDEISEDSAALLCLTNKTNCCSSAETGSGAIGNWFLPNGESVSGSGDFYSNRGPSVVHLHRRNNAQTTGLFRCEVEDASGTNQQLYVGVYPVNFGSPSITGIVFDRSTLTLTCISTGGPATTVTWIKNGVVVKVDDTNYQQSQRVLNTEMATYENILSSSDIVRLVGNFNCCASSIRGFSCGSITQNGIRIINIDNPLIVGGISNISCVSDTPANTIEFLDSQGIERVVASVTSINQLDLIFNPVNDSIHNTDYTCRVTRQDENVTLTTTIAVYVPSDSLMANITRSGYAVAGGMYSLQCDISTTIPGLANTPTATWIGLNGSPVTSGGSITITSNTAATSILTFNSLTTSQAGRYTCEGSIESPALEDPQIVREIVEIDFQIPPSTVIVDVPNGTTYAGTHILLTCIITVNDAVNTDIEVDITWTPNDRLNIQTTTGSRPSFTSTVTVSPLSSADTGFTCSAVIRPPSGSRFITASNPGMDTANITVQVPPPPTMDITTVGLSIIGDPYNLTCRVTVVENLLQSPTVMWTGSGVGQTDVEINGPIVSGPVTTLTLSFSQLHTNHGGQYTCRAVFHIPNAGFPPLTGMASQDVTVLDAFFQLRLTGHEINNCRDWVADRAIAKSADITAAVMTNIARRCRCNFTIGAGGFQCIKDSVIYRAEVKRAGNAHTTVSDVIVHIEDWVTSGTGIVVQSLFINIDSNCGVLVRDVNDDCPLRLDTQLVSDMRTEPETNSEPSSETLSTEAPQPIADNTITVAIIGGVVAVVLTLAVTITVITALVLKNRRAAVRSKPDPLPAVVLSDISRTGDYEIENEYEDPTKYSETYAEVKPPEKRWNSRTSMKK